MKKSYKKVTLTCACIFCVLIGFTQAGKINAEEASKHVGDSLSVCGKVYGGIYLEKSKGQPTLLNIGGVYPNNPLTVVILGEEKLVQNCA